MARNEPRRLRLDPGRAERLSPFGSDAGLTDEALPQLECYSETHWSWPRAAAPSVLMGSRLSTVARSPLDPPLPRPAEQGVHHLGPVRALAHPRNCFSSLELGQNRGPELVVADGLSWEESGLKPQALLQYRSIATSGVKISPARRCTEVSWSRARPRRGRCHQPCSRITTPRPTLGVDLSSDEQLHLRGALPSDSRQLRGCTYAPNDSQKLVLHSMGEDGFVGPCQPTRRRGHLRRP